MTRSLFSVLAALVLTVVAVGCGGDDDDATDAESVPVDSSSSDDVDDAGSADDSGSGGDVGASPDDGAPIGADPTALPTTAWDPATIETVAFSPTIECPLLSYEEANAERSSNLQPLEVTESSCMFDNGSIIDGELFVAVGSPGTFDPADPALVSELDPEITVEDVSSPGTNARLMSMDFAGEAIHYGMVFEVDGTEVLVTADRMRFTPDQLASLAGRVADRVPGATFTPASAEVQTTGGGFCSLYDGAAIQAGLGASVSSASWQAGDIAGCRWYGDFAAVVEVSRPLGGSIDPNTDNPDLRIDDLGVPAAKDMFADWIVNVEIDGVHVVVSSASYEDSLVIARNLVERATS